MRLTILVYFDLVCLQFCFTVRGVDVCQGDTALGMAVARVNAQCYVRKMCSSDHGRVRDVQVSVMPAVLENEASSGISSCCAQAVARR